MSFTDEQRAMLDADLDGRLVRTRKQAGQTLSYLEGWVIKAKLNRLFGSDGWAHRVVHLEYRHWDGKNRSGETRAEVEAVATVELQIGDHRVVDVGGGNGFGSTAMQDAAKEAVTDGLKRAAAGLGWSMGLALYDPSRRHVK